MKFTRLLAPAFVATFIATAVTAQEDPTADTVLATVNGKEITVGHMIALTERLPEQYQSLQDEQLFKGVLEQLIQQTALASNANTDQRSVKLAIENETRALLASEVLAKIEQDAVTDEKVKAEYETAFASAEPTKEFNAAHILVETEDEAKALIEALEGGAVFADLAKEKSTGPSGPNGGDLGWFALGRMVPEFEKAVVDMKAGEFSAPVQTQFGWHVINLVETRDKPIPELAEVRDQLVDALKSKAVSSHLEGLEASAEITRTEVEVDPSIIRNTDLLDQ